MTARALGEDKIRPFLQRRRRGSQVVDLPPVAGMLKDTLNFLGRLLPTKSAALYLDDPLRRRDPSTPLTLLAGYGLGRTKLGSEVFSDADFFKGAYLRGHRPIVTTDSTARAARVLIPVRLEHAVCGVLSVTRQGRQPFSVHELALLDLFARYISRAILNAVDILKQNALALRDELTGLYGVRALDPMLHREIETAQKTRKDLALLFIDLDHLKQINDLLGHRAGSEALRRVGRAIDVCLAKRGTAFRFGGDEFVVICPKTNAESALAISTEIRQVVPTATEGPMPDGEMLPAISVSIGVATLRHSLRRGGDVPTRATRLLGAADRALYRAKGPRNASVLAAPRDDSRGVEDARRKQAIAKVAVPKKRTAVKTKKEPTR